jgi:hypothetical protein
MAYLPTMLFAAEMLRFPAYSWNAYPRSANVQIAAPVNLGTAGSSKCHAVSFGKFAIPGAAKQVNFASRGQHDVDTSR